MMIAALPFMQFLLDLSLNYLTHTLQTIHLDGLGPSAQGILLQVFIARCNTVRHRCILHLLHSILLRQ